MPHSTRRFGAEEQVIVRVRPGAGGNGVDFAVDGPHWILDRALLEGLDVHHHGRIQGGLLCKQGGIDDVDLVIGVGPAGHEQVHVETAHHVDDTTPPDIRDLNGIYGPCPCTTIDLTEEWPWRRRRNSAASDTDTC